VVKRLLIACFIGNISAKKISKSVHVCHTYSKPKVGRFLSRYSLKVILFTSYSPGTRTLNPTKLWLYSVQDMMKEHKRLSEELMLQQRAN